MAWIDTNVLTDGTKSYSVRDRDADGRKVRFGNYRRLGDARRRRAQMENATLNTELPVTPQKDIGEEGGGELPGQQGQEPGL